VNYSAPGPWRIGRGTAIFRRTKSWEIAMLFRAPESHSRSFVKAVSWRVLGSIDTFVISYFVTHQLVFAASIASVETVTKVVLFYAHERVWTVVPWGRKPVIAAPEEPAAAVTPPAVTAAEAA
jgi:uncharacterized membrane protein